MRRLLQGDVGSGKTIVAFQAMLVAMENGYQAALMAPTEILATQHFLAARKLLERSSRKPRIVLLTGSLDDDRKRTIAGSSIAARRNLVIGTHALIEEKVEFDRLGLVVVDEQHRFGVLQRFKLMKKPNQPEPDVLVMTATPIPRTLALSLYGDLDLSVLDEMPPGRIPIVTRRVPGERAGEVWDFVRKQVAQGRQAYIVYPVIEGTKDDQPELDFSRDEPTAQVESARPAAQKKTRSKKTADLFPRAAQEASPNAKSGLQIGRRDAREAALWTADRSACRPPAWAAGRGRKRSHHAPLPARRDRRAGFDHCDRGGRRRGQRNGDGGGSCGAVRAGAIASVARARGARRSKELLHSHDRRADVSELGEQRLDAMVRTQDGFELAELDLEIRGPGEFFGTRQAGLPEFRVANLLRDRQLLELAKQEAAAICQSTRRGRYRGRTDARVGAAQRGVAKEIWARRGGLAGLTRASY